jgi:hypothetical protein
MLQCISPTKIGVRLQSGNEAGNGAGRDIPGLRDTARAGPSSEIP